MGLLPMNLDILPPSDDRVFKLLLTSPEAKPGLINLISGLIGRNVVDVAIHSNELPPGDTKEKAERFDVNCKIDDGSQVNIEMQSSRMKEDLDGQHRNLKGKSIYYLTDLHSSQPAKGIPRYDHLARSYQITFCSYTVFPNQPDYVNSFSMRHDTTGELLSDAIHITFVELSKLDEILKKSVSDMTALDKCESIVESQRERNKSEGSKDVKKQTSQRTNVGSILDARFHINPVKERFDRLAAGTHGSI